MTQTRVEEKTKSNFFSRSVVVMLMRTEVEPKIESKLH